MPVSSATFTMPNWTAVPPSRATAIEHFATASRLVAGVQGNMATATHGNAELGDVGMNASNAAAHIREGVLQLDSLGATISSNLSYFLVDKEAPYLDDLSGRFTAASRPGGQGPLFSPVSAQDGAAFLGKTQADLAEAIDRLRE